MTLAPKNSPRNHAFLVIVVSIGVFACPLVVNLTHGQYRFSSVAGIVLACAVLLLHLAIGFVVTRLTTKKRIYPYGDESAELIIDNDWPLEGDPLSSAILFVFARSGTKTHLSRIIAAFVDAAFLSAAAEWLNWQSIVSLGLTNDASLAVLVFGWFATLLARWQLIACIPYEPNTFHAQDTFGIDMFSRVSHISILLAANWILQVPKLAVYFIWACLPIIWPIAWLPSLRILILNLVEFVNYTIFGLSPTLSRNRALFIFVFAGTSLAVVTYFSSQSSYIGSIVATALGTLLSSSVPISLVFNTNTKSRNAFQMLGFNSIGLSLLNGWLLLQRIAIGVILIHLQKYFVPHYTYFTYAVLITTALIKLTRMLQQVYLGCFAPLVLNPLRRFPTLDKILWPVRHLHTLCYNLAPFLLQIIVICQLEDWSNALQGLGVDRYALGYSIISTILTLRAMAVIWSRVESTSLDFSVVLLMDIVSLSTCIEFQGFSWCSISICVKIFVIAIIRELLADIVEKSQLWIVMLGHFLTDRKERHARYILLLAPIIVISPISIFISAVFRAPIMPFLGLPIFIIVFARPTIFWMEADATMSTGNDASLYESLAPSLLASISHAVAAGSLTALFPGSTLIARIESRVIIIRIIETWFEGYDVTLSGTELEETSCHSLEGAYVDSVLTPALIFDDPYRKTNWINTNLFSAFQPVGKVSCTNHTESKIVTTGILDQRALLSKITSVYLKVLIYILHMKSRGELMVGSSDVQVPQAVTESLGNHFPTDWYFQVVNMQNMNQEKNNETIIASEFIKLSLAIYSIIVGIGHVSFRPVFTPDLVFEALCGNIALSVPLESKRWFESPKMQGLRQAALLAFRIAIKLLYEQAVVCDADMDSKDLMEYISDAMSAWHISIDPLNASKQDVAQVTSDIQEAITSGDRNIFVFSKSKRSEPISVRLLKRQPGSVVLIGQLNSHAVMGIWANLAFELLYLTNDDDERYSIQAHTVLKTNLENTQKLGCPERQSAVWLSYLDNQCVA